ncbi:MAG TPA: zinc-ribbon domain-containing protein [Ignavibacteria bacterium]|nr:zinc-ribbon domain-containing protein [Ignavibacteria bacterium]
MIIGGWGKKSKKVADAGLLRCKNCNNTAAFEIRELASTASLYFIPVAKWNKKTYLVCPICKAGYELPEDDVKKLMQEIVSLPSNDTSIEIWNKIDLLFVEFTKENKNLEEWNDFAKEELSKTYKKDDTKYVLSCYNKSLVDFIDK